MGGGGICFVGAELLKQGEILEVELKLPDQDQPIVFLGKVSWTDLLKVAERSYEESSYETGVQFVSIDPKQRDIIVQWAQMNTVPEMEDSPESPKPPETPSDPSVSP